MIVYLFAFGLSLLIYKVVAHNKIEYSIVDNKTNIFSGVYNRISVAIVLASIPPIIVSGIRYAVGTDYFSTYYTGFYRIMDNISFDKFEPGYALLNRFIQLFTKNVFALFFITSIIFVGIVYISIKEQSVDIPVSIILFLVTRYYFIGQNGVRQFIAIAIVTYSLKYVINRNFKKFMICVLLAASFHYTGLLFIVVYFLGNMNITKKKFAIITLLDLSFFLFGTTIIDKVLKGTKYIVLINKFDVSGIKFTIFTITLNAILLLVAYYKYNQRKEDDKYRVYANIQMIAFWLSLALRLLPLIERIYWMFSFPIIITFPYFIKKGYFKKRKILQFLILSVFFVYMIYDIVFLKDHGILPYQTIFGHEPIHYSGWGTVR